MTPYPGLGLPLRQYPRDGKRFYPLGLHAECVDSNSALLPVREVAMMNIMERLTDKENWHKMIFDDEIVKQWREEALKHPNKLYWKQATDNKGANAINDVRRPPAIMDTATFGYCVKELRNKSNYYIETGIIPTLDASATIVKSDLLVQAGLRVELQEAFNKLKADQGSKLNWRPNSNEQVLDLVHPSMYPLVYGRTGVLQDEVVGTTDAIDKWAGKGEQIAKETTPIRRDADSLPASLWSDTYQWLPANVRFMEDGTVKFTSYINNLHPQKYAQIYRTIEKLIEAALPTWDQCLSLPLERGTKIGAGRTEPRFPKQDLNDYVSEIWDPPSPPPLDDDDDEDDDEDDDGDDDNDDDEDEDEDDPAFLEWKRTRKPVHPSVPEFEDIEYTPRDTARLAHKFNKTGLQVIVKMTSIELTPEKPELSAEEWHVKGQMNEQICATTLYCVDSDNIAPSNIHFRMQTAQYIQGQYPTIRHDAKTWFERTHGTSLVDGTCLQIYGTVQMHEGRLLTFPNVFQQRESSIKLKDTSKPGSRHLISLQLVDPNARIISTANVPPQQHDWWASAVFGQSLQSDSAALAKFPPDLVAILQQKGFVRDSPISGGKLPVELLRMVRAHLYNNESGMPMSEEEAQKHRAELLTERIEHHIRADLAWSNRLYYMFLG
ncbi:uncharacterized protein TRIVIDRAFT_37955 [Trichoderma virens Gv29-8]|uniref:Uncharacterized protein n=1 Tax=Hypocrea virens (strain Gv29-8 / FGSC 10586) TaxID=413071 RepID=G9ND28_HYPVG|nr:uncharacterized protein TRIVIDRAFT_37955 [Trichoderma virens Gv29-8]EHK15597.1 hypothetical protein TRIVIDRAFT_37955 [Trichoderma virens Gv29-8]